MKLNKRTFSYSFVSFLILFGSRNPFMYYLNQKYSTNKLPADWAIEEKFACHVKPLMRTILTVVWCESMYFMCWTRIFKHFVVKVFQFLHLRVLPVYIIYLLASNARLKNRKLPILNIYVFFFNILHVSSYIGHLYNSEVIQDKNCHERKNLIELLYCIHLQYATGVFTVVTFQ